ncbi:MAG: efflux transporter outer membrane subunit [Rikenellaceae bacterium]|nr:efflux transporter outer membrane subunit [Rikenellaceae bacterium]
MKRILIIISLTIGLCACNARLTPPQISIPTDYSYAQGVVVDSLGVDFAWWEYFGDSMLNDLIMRAIANNRNLLVAASRIEQARIELGNVRSNYLPSFAFEVSAEGNYTKETRIEQQYQIAPTMSWEIPLFGALRHSRSSAYANLYATKWAFRGVMLSLTAEVATSYFTLLQYRSSLEVARSTYQLRRISAALMDSMYRYGFASAVERQQSYSLADAAAVDIPNYERAVVQTAAALSTLMGEYPLDSIVESAAALHADRLPLSVPVGLPSSLLERRPDVLEAYYGVEQAAAQVNVERVARFPTLSLTASGGVLSSTIEGLTSSNPLSWSAAAHLLQPIYAFGRLKRNELSAREDYYQAVKQYEQSILQAFADVSDALSQISTYAREVERYAAMLESDRRIYELAKALYSNGMNSYTDLVDAERTLYDSQMSYAEVRAQQYIAYVNLFKALGGGW